MFGLVAALAALTYTNPLIENCADPSIVRGDNSWFVYCTSDPLTDGDPGSISSASTDPMTSRIGITSEMYLRSVRRG